MSRSARRRAQRVVGVFLLGIVSLHVQAEVTSIADWSCSTWTVRRAEGIRADPPQMWLAGFMTGLATALRVDVLAITEAPAMFAWMDDFCAEHPDEVLSTGGGILFNELLARLPTSRPYLSGR